MRLNKTLKILGIFLALFLFLGIYSSQALAKERYEEKFEKTESLAKDGEVTLKNVSGGIEVKSWNKNQVRIEALKVSKASSLSKAKEGAAKVAIEVEKEGNSIRIETKYPKSKIWKKSVNVSVHYNLWIPEKASIKVKSVSGSVGLEEIGGTAKVDVVSGNVEVKKADKEVDCQTVSGKLILQDITGDAYLKTVSGKIVVNRIRGSIDAETVSGGLDLIEVSKAKVVKGKVLSGSIVYKGDINPEGKYKLKAFSGTVEMILPADSSFEFEAKTFSGTIKTDFKVTTTGVIKKTEMHGVVNQGGADVTLETFSGSIYLRKK
jgi:hypothetical protein